MSIELAVHNKQTSFYHLGSKTECADKQDELDQEELEQDDVNDNDTKEASDVLLPQKSKRKRKLINKPVSICLFNLCPNIVYCKVKLSKEKTFKNFNSTANVLP